MPIARAATDASLMEGVSCDDSGCVTQAAAAASWRWRGTLEALTDDCDRARLDRDRQAGAAGCAAPVIDKRALAPARRDGAAARS